MNYLHIDLENDTLINDAFRRVIYTLPHMQVVLMSFEPLVSTGNEIHLEHDQFIKVEAGEGVAIIENKTLHLFKGVCVVIPRGTYHEIINKSLDSKLKLYTIYTPKMHASDTLELRINE